MVVYFIYFTFVKGAEIGDGNIDVTVDCSINSIDSLRKIERGLIDKFGYDSVVICNFKKLYQPEVEKTEKVEG